MGRHDLQVSSSRRSAIVPEVLPETSAKPGANASFGEMMFSQSDRGEMAKMAMSGVVDISRKFADIAEIKAKSAVEVAAIQEDVKRIAADAKAYVDKRKADNEDWHSRFDKAMGFVRTQLNEHPDWSDELKSKVIDVVIKAMENR